MSLSTAFNFDALFSPAVGFAFDALLSRANSFFFAASVLLPKGFVLGGAADGRMGSLVALEVGFAAGTRGVLAGRSAAGAIVDLATGTGWAAAGAVNGVSGAVEVVDVAVASTGPEASAEIDVAGARVRVNRIAATAMHSNTAAIRRGRARYARDRRLAVEGGGAGADVGGVGGPAGTMDRIRRSVESTTCRVALPGSEENAKGAISFASVEGTVGGSPVPLVAVSGGNVSREAGCSGSVDAGGVGRTITGNLYTTRARFSPAFVTSFC